jgi:hypothetical protein
VTALGLADVAVQRGRILGAAVAVVRCVRIHRERHILPAVRAVHDHPVGVVFLEPLGHLNRPARVQNLICHHVPLLNTSPLK